MKSGTNGSCTQYKHGVDFYSLDISGFEDIGSALQFSPQTALTLRVLPDELQRSIQEQRSENRQISINNPNSLKISLKAVLETLGIQDYEIIDDDKFRSIELHKRRGVTHIGSKNDFGDFHIQSIHGHVNQCKPGYMNKFSFGGKNAGTYVLFYNTRLPPTILEKISHLFGSPNKTASRISSLLDR